MYLLAATKYKEVWIPSTLYEKSNFFFGFEFFVTYEKQRCGPVRMGSFFWGGRELFFAVLWGQGGKIDLVAVCVNSNLLALYHWFPMAKITPIYVLQSFM